MIVFAEEIHKEQIASLWSEAFGDKKSDVLIYLESILEYFIVFVENKTVCGMLSMLPIRYKGEYGRYIYAVATRLDKRGKGISTALINFAKKFIEEKEETFLVLVPQSESLFEFYEKRGFKPFSCIEQKEYYENYTADEMGTVKKITAESYEIERKKFFSNSNFIEWDKHMLEFAQNMYNGDFLYVSDGEQEIGTAFCLVMGNTLHIKELLSNQPEKMAKILKKYYNISRVLYAFPSYDCTPFAMIYPETKEKIYFNIALE